MNLDDPGEVNLFIARMQRLNSNKDGLVKTYNYHAQSYSISYVKPKFTCEKKLPDSDPQGFDERNFCLIEEVCSDIRF